MPRYIDSEQAIRLIENDALLQVYYSKSDAIDCIDATPTADVANVKHGKWKPCFEDWRKQIEGDECSVCGFRHYGTSIRTYHYCPNCGARMDGEGE